MRILISTDTIGGVWDHCVTLAGGLCAAGHTVLLAVLGEPRDARLAVLPEGVQVTSRPYRLEWMADAEADVVAAGKWLRETASLWQADVVHLNQMAYAAQDFEQPVLTVVHSDVLSWYGGTRREPAPREHWAGYTRWVCDGLIASDVVAAPTAFQAGLVRVHYGIPNVRVVHNGVTPPTHAPLPRATETVLSVGRGWDAAKGMHVLDEAIRRLGAAAPPAHLLGETEGPGGEHLTARHLQVHGRVGRSEVDAWMERASIYVAASLYEPFGLAPLEAALRGCALVLSDIASFRELWDGCACFFPAGDADMLATTLASLAAEPARRAGLATAARTRALRRYTTAHMVVAYLELYQQLRATVGA
jgi:glycogen synthase